MKALAVSARPKHARYVLTPWSAQGALDMPAIDRAEGSYLYDAQGKRYLDLSAGLVAVNLGHGHPALVRAISDQAATLCYAAPSFFNTERADLAEALSEVSPWTEGARTFFTTGGGEANEDAVKMARQITGRHKVLCAYRSFHGSAPGAGTLTGENRRWPNEPGMPGVVHFVTPFPYRSPFDTTDLALETQRALAHLDFILTYEDPERIAAILVEPVVGTNGVIVYPPEYLAGLRERCDRFGMLLIFDEVMTGFGRTGEPFAATRFGVVPDAMTFAKGCTSAYVPLGGVMLRERLAAYFDSAVLGCGHTYSGHPLAIAAARAALRVYRDDGLFWRARDIDTWLRQDLGRLQDRVSIVGDVRGVGAFFAIELVKNRATKEPLVAWQGPSAGVLPGFLRRLRDYGVYLFGRYNVLLITPPLTIGRDELDEGIQALEVALLELAGTL